MEILASVAQVFLPAVIALTAVLFTLVPVLKDSISLKRRESFRKQIRKGIIRQELSYEDMQHIAERWFQDRKALLQSLRALHSDAIAGEDEELSEQTQAIRDLIKKHQEEEPYSELPENISLQLSNLVRIQDSSSAVIGQLASSLSELYSSNQARLARQVRFTYWGVVVGILGVLIGIAGLYFAVSAQAV